MQIHHRYDDRCSDLPSLPCNFFVAWVHCLAAHVCICLQIYNHLQSINLKKIFRGLVWVICTRCTEWFLFLAISSPWIVPLSRETFLLGNHRFQALKNNMPVPAKFAKHIAPGSRTEPFLSNRIWEKHTHTQFFDQKCERPHSAFRILDSSNPSLPVRPLWGLLFGCYVFGASRRVWKPRRTWPKEFSLNIQNPPNTWWGSVFGTLKSLLRRCLGFQTPIHQVFGCLGFKGFKQIPPLLMGAFGKFSNPSSRSWRLCELQLAQFFGVFFFFCFPTWSVTPFATVFI